MVNKTQLDKIRVRHHAVDTAMTYGTPREWVYAAVKSSDDVPVLLIEIERLQVQNVMFQTALEKIRDTAKSWEGRSKAPYWNLGDIAAAVLKKMNGDK